jgi:hypothetical protein
MVEAKQQDNEQDLVEELTPTLHQESAGNLAATVQTVLFRRDLAGSNSVLHTAGRSHWIFTTDTNAIEEQGPGVANDPAILSNSPGRGKHQKTDKHDCGILNQTPSSTEPVPDNSNQNLANNDTANLEIIDRIEPLSIADFVLGPTGGEGGLEEGF